MADLLVESLRAWLRTCPVGPNLHLGVQHQVAFGNSVRPSWPRAHFAYAYKAQSGSKLFFDYSQPKICCAGNDGIVKIVSA